MPIQLVAPRLLMATNDPTDARTSIFVQLSARAIGSLGFAVVGFLLCNQLTRQLNSLSEPSRHLFWMAFTSILNGLCTL
jgi:hypothetical protein